MTGRHRQLAFMLLLAGVEGRRLTYASGKKDRWRERTR
jgi:hypothetical protein